MCRFCNLPLHRYRERTIDGVTTWLLRHPAPEDARLCLQIILAKKSLDTAPPPPPQSYA